jgi:hypothetical protein
MSSVSTAGYCRSTHAFISWLRLRDRLSLSFINLA